MGRWISGSLLSPNRLAGVVSLAMLAEHHLRLVLQSLHMLRILQASRLWGEAVPVSSLPKACLIPQPPKYQATPLFSAPPPPRKTIHLYSGGFMRSPAEGGHQNP